MKKIFSLMVILSVAITLVACGESKDNLRAKTGEVDVTHTITTGGVINDSNDGWNTTNSSKQTVTEKFNLNPKKVAVFNYDIVDILVTIGIDEAGITNFAYPQAAQGFPPYLNDLVSGRNDTNAGTIFVPDWTALKLFQPELIVIGGRTAGAYDEFKKQFPNADILDVSIVYGDFIEGVERNVTNLANIFPAVKEDLTNKLASLKTQMGEVSEIAKDHKALFLMVNGESISFYAPTGRFAVIHDEFGFAAADPSFGGSDPTHGQLGGYEYINAVNPEILIIMDRAGTLGQAPTSALQNVLDNTIVKQTKAGVNGDVYVVDGGAFYLSPGGFKSIEIMIENFSTFVTKYKTAS